MQTEKSIFVINGSASKNSSNKAIINHIVNLAGETINFQFCDDLKTLPHFDPEQSISCPPVEIIALREKIHNADGVMICTPEYVFSIPSGLKNLIEWCVATTVFSGKPVGLITASANGEKGHEELMLLMKTLMVNLKNETTLLIPGVKGKIESSGQLNDQATKIQLADFFSSFLLLIRN